MSRLHSTLLAGPGLQPGAGQPALSLVDVTPELAAHVIAEWRYPRQRRLDARHVALLAAAIQAGEFELCSVQIHHLGEQCFLTDGQHRMHAIVASGRTVQLLVIHRDAPDMHAVDAAYRRIDIGRLRSSTQQLLTEGLDEELDLTASQVSYLAQAGIVLADGFTSACPASDWAMRSCELKIRAVRNLAPEGRRFFEVTHGAASAISRRLKASPVLAVALMTLRHQPNVAATFWKLVSQDDQLRRGTGEHVLARLLSGTPVRELTTSDYSRRVAACWNAHFDSREISQSWSSRAKLESIHIVGTPYSQQREPIRMDFRLKTDEQPALFTGEMIR